MASLAKVFRAPFLIALFILSCALSPASAEDAGQSSSGTQLPRPTSSYMATSADGVPVKLNYFSPQDGISVVFVIGETGQPLKRLPSIEEQGKLLDGLLSQLVSEHKDLPSTFPLFLTGTKDSLTTELVAKLHEKDANWNPKTGQPKRGHFNEVVTAELNTILQSSPIAQAFQSHGYKLELTDIEKIEMQVPAKKGDGKYPQYINSMDIDATKISTGG
ncbi:hypothetical protein ACXHMN_20020 [Rhizobium sp. LEGMi12c]